MSHEKTITNINGYVSFTIEEMDPVAYPYLEKLASLPIGQIDTIRGAITADLSASILKQKRNSSPNTTSQSQNIIKSSIDEAKQLAANITDELEPLIKVLKEPELLRHNDDLTSDEVVRKEIIDQIKEECRTHKKSQSSKLPVDVSKIARALSDEQKKARLKSGEKANNTISEEQCAREQITWLRTPEGQAYLRNLNTAFDQENFRDFLQNNLSAFYGLMSQFLPEDFYSSTHFQQSLMRNLQSPEVHAASYQILNSALNGASIQEIFSQTMTSILNIARQNMNWTDQSTSQNIDSEQTTQSSESVPAQQSYLDHPRLFAVRHFREEFNETSNLNNTLD